MENNLQLTQWEKRCSCCCFQFNFVTQINKFFCNHWECKFHVPFLVLSFISATYITFCFEYFYYLPHKSLKSFYTISAFFLLLIWSYFATICEGPGYLPFYYPSMHPLRTDGSVDYLSGLAINENQEQYIKSHQLPTRTNFFHSTYRIVIRPDHYCNWIESFIGKRNQKLFLLVLVYGFCYSSLFFIHNLRAIYYIFKLQTFSPLMIISILFLIISLIFEIYLFTEVLQQFIGIITNYTSFDRLKQQHFETSGCWQNIQEVFGSWKQIIFWPIPIGAFCFLDDYLLVDDLEKSKKQI